MAEKPRDSKPVKAGRGKAPGRAGEPRAKPAAERMVRKQVLLTSAQSRWLKKQSAEIGLTESEIIRSALDREAGTGEPEDNWRERLSALVGSIKDEGLAERIAENRKRWRERMDRFQRDLDDDE
jgi:hypothetical protein